MDGSRRSSHGNAYFTGFGAREAHRVLRHAALAAAARGNRGGARARARPFQAEARASSASPWFAAASLASCWRCSAGWSASRGSTRDSACRSRRRATASRWCCSCSRCRCSPSSLAPLSSLYSRRHEFEADAYAAEHASAPALVAALVKLYEDNANTLTPDPAALGVLRFASARRGAHRAARSERRMNIRCYPEDESMSPVT